MQKTKIWKLGTEYDSFLEKSSYLKTAPIGCYNVRALFENDQTDLLLKMFYYFTQDRGVLMGIT